jgi:hypothetical protein
VRQRLTDASKENDLEIDTQLSTESQLRKCSHLRVVVNVRPADGVID